MRLDVACLELRDQQLARTQAVFTVIYVICRKNWLSIFLNLPQIIRQQPVSQPIELIGWRAKSNLSPPRKTPL
jgi:hypothetical protein